MGAGFKILVGAPLFFPLDSQTKGGVVVGTPRPYLEANKKHNKYERLVESHLSQSIF